MGLKEELKLDVASKTAWTNIGIENEIYIRNTKSFVKFNSKLFTFLTELTPNFWKTRLKEAKHSTKHPFSVKNYQML